MIYKNFHVKARIIIFAVLIGILSGLVSILFNQALNYGYKIVGYIYQNKIWMFILPIMIGLITAFTRKHLLKTQGFGVSQVMYEVETIQYQVMKGSDVFLKILMTILNLIAGFSVGRQGPVVHLGGAIGSKVAYYNKFDNSDTRVLIGCGVAGCLAGVFNAPIFATLFVVEIMFKKRYFDMISTILMSALSATVFIRLFRNESFFSIFLSNYHYDMHETPHFLLLGLGMTAFAVLYVFALNKTKTFFNEKVNGIYIRSIIGALAVALSLLLLSDYFFYDLKPSMLFTTNFSTIHLFAIGLVYIILTSISLGTGSIGGIFAPGLFIGLTIGYGYANLFELLGLSIGDHRTYAVAGMAAMFSGFAIAPLTSTLMIVELTGQYNLIFPVLLACLITSTISELIIKDSIYHKGLNELL